MRRRMGIDLRFEHGQPAMHAAAHAATTRVAAAAVVTSGVTKAAAMGAPGHLREHDMADGRRLRALHHALARARAAHA